MVSHNLKYGVFFFRLHDNTRLILFLRILLSSSNYNEKLIYPKINNYSNMIYYINDDEVFIIEHKK